MSGIKPFLKWAGGKFRLLGRILPELSDGRRYVEPFSGSAVVYLNRPSPHAVVNDVNADLVALYVHLQEEGEAFITYAAGFFSAENNTRAAFHSLRDQFNRTGDARKRAALLLYLNRHAFNGLIRYNAGGGYNVPFGSYRAPRFPLEEMRHFCKRTSQGQTAFTCRDFRDVFADLEPGDVVYCDPPYVPLSATANFTGYTGKSFGPKDQRDLAHLARNACKNGITVVLSNHDTPQVRQLYAGARIISFEVRRSISCKGNKRHNAQELLAIYRG